MEAFLAALVAVVLVMVYAEAAVANNTPGLVMSLLRMATQPRVSSNVTRTSDLRTTLRCLLRKDWIGDEAAVVVVGQDFVDGVVGEAPRLLTASD